MIMTDAVVAGLNVGLCVALGGFVAWAILSYRVRDGVIIKLGLILMALGLFGSTIHFAGGGYGPPEGALLARSTLATHLGMVLCAIGVALRLRRGESCEDFIDRLAHRGGG